MTLGRSLETIALLRSLASEVKPRDADLQQIGIEFGEFAANLFGLRVCCEFAVKFTALRIRCELSLRVRWKLRPRRHRRIGNFLDFCSADFSTFFRSSGLKFYRALVHFKNQLCIVRSSILLRF